MRLGVLPTVASKICFSHHCRSIGRQSDHQVLFSYLSRFFMLTVAPQTDFLLVGRCLQLSLNNFSLAELAGTWFFSPHPQVSSTETDLLIESYRHFPPRLTLPVNLFTKDVCTYLALIHEPPQQAHREVFKKQMKYPQRSGRSHLVGTYRGR